MITKPASRMTLANIRTGRLNAPLRLLPYGVHGVGKSSFAKDAPKPIFFGRENGTEELDVARLPQPRDWDEVLEGIAFLQNTETDYRTLVCDPLNWFEPLVWAKVCADNGWTTIEEPGFGKGYEAALDHWRVFIAHLERLWETKGFNIILCAHAHVKPFKAPDADTGFDRYEIAMNAKAANLFKQWASAVLFAKHEFFAMKEKGERSARGISTGARKLFTQWTAAYDAKNRYNLPAELPLSWEAFAAAVEAGRGTDAAGQKAQADEIRARIEAHLADADEKYAANARGFVASAKNDLGRLAEIENRIATRLSSTKQAA